MALPRLFLACVFLSSLAAVPASADEVVVFSNIGPGNSFDTSRASWFGFDTGEEGDPDYHFSRAMSFVAGGTGTLSAIELPVRFPSAFSSGTLEINLFDEVGGLPGAVLERFSSAGPLPAGSLSVFRSVLAPLLAAGNTYYLEARTLGMADGLWYIALEEAAGLHRDVYRSGDGPWGTGQREFTAAFRVTADVNAAPVPEPATMLLLGTGLAVAAVRRRRARE